MEERFASPKLAAFAQRIAARCYLESFDRAETAAYVRAQITQAGGDADSLFGGDALEAVYRASDGIPRLINQICDHALVLAFAGGQKHIDAAGIEEAWADLQQLPSPWNDETEKSRSAARTDDFIEFGVLGEDESDVLGARAAVFQPDDEVAVDSAPSTISMADFEPSLRQTPEVELVFTPGSDPFNESFAEEEVIVNPYAEIDARIKSRTTVQSGEGRVLSAILAVQDELSRAIAPAATAQPPLAPTVADVAPTSRSTPPLEGVLSVPRLSLDLDHVLPEEAWTPPKPEPSVAAAWWGIDAMPVFSTSTDDVPLSTIETSDDENIMIVEDPEPVAPAKVNPVVRRREFRQLFAQLRQS